MRIALVLLAALTLLACGANKKEPLSAQEIVDKAIEVSGGERYQQSEFSFEFRDRKYSLKKEGKKKVLKRTTYTDTAEIVDIKSAKGHQRYIDNQLVRVSDSMSTRYGNSVNSVHYFAYLPYGLNDAAVNKRFLGMEDLMGTSYYKIEITFDQQGGGDDFEDTYVYWFNTETFKPDYLAYEFHVDGGGLRFREAYNERYVNGVRFVDYCNYKPEKGRSVYETGKLFEGGELELLSTVALSKIEVSPDSYN